MQFSARQGNSRLTETIEKPLVEGKSAPAYVESYVDDAALPYLWFDLDIPGSFGLRRIRRQFQFFKWFFSTQRPSRRRRQRNRQQQPRRHQLWSAVQCQLC